MSKFQIPDLPTQAIRRANQAGLTSPTTTGPTHCFFLPTEQWHHTLLDIPAWARRESSNLLLNHSGMGRALLRTCKRWLLT
ncbi:hypothetical protein ACET3Z_016036 [Daucus carota]